jgi:hypothetical protein
MNYYDAQEIVRLHGQGKPINYGSVEEARAFLDGMSTPRTGHRGTVIRPAAPPAVMAFPPTMDTRCTCGLRYGQHRVNDYRCPNQEWKPGNGKAQWLTAVFRRGA